MLYSYRLEIGSVSIVFSRDKILSSLEPMNGSQMLKKIVMKLLVNYIIHNFINCIVFVVDRGKIRYLRIYSKDVEH